MKAEIEVLQPGLLSTIQDRGRRGFLQYGVPISGPMDSFSAGMANLLLKNDPDAAVLEITQLGPKLLFSEPTQIVICGASLSPKVDGEPVANNEVIEILSGSVLSFGRRIEGGRTYLGIKNGFQTEVVLNSRSWFQGITEASRLEKGMRLKYNVFSEGLVEKNASVKEKAEIFSEEIEAFPGPEYDLLSAEEKKELIKRPFSVNKNNNRMGIQLDEELQNNLEPILSSPVIPGTVQLTASGKMIVLMRDAQTTGGYPRILQLSEKGINTLAQKVQGEKIRFQIKKNKGVE